MKIYLVEDDTNIRNLVLYTLTASGYEAQGFEEAKTFYKELERQLPDLILLDIMLPGEDGLAILKKLRKNKTTADLPVIMLTAKDSEYDKVLGLDSGADDYITKPFGMMELVSRIKALLRRMPQKQAGEEEICLGDILLLPQKRIVLVGETAVSLTMKEFDLLALLMGSPGHVFKRDTLMEKIWGYDYEGETRTLDVHIRSLRFKLGSAGEAIKTVRGVGYKVVEPL